MRKIKNLQIVDESLIKSGLVNGLDLEYLKKKYQINTVIDLSDKDRLIVKRWCEKNNIEYHKFYVDRKNPNKKDYINALNVIKKTTLVFCFHGRSRSRALVALWQIKNGASTTKVIDQLRIEMPDGREEILQLIAECSFDII